MICSIEKKKSILLYMHSFLRSLKFKNAVVNFDARILALLRKRERERESKGEGERIRVLLFL